MTLNNKKIAAVVLALTVATSLSACSNWSKRDRNTAIGAGAGAVGGAGGIKQGCAFIPDRVCRRHQPGSSPCGCG